ncbi:hypothetical protein BDV41DRAFT_540439 [Aspergillus transmontanensis]|uniref:Fungal-type protein kinase domain-containing protein n=1 Tax=Aspergillus transmontanensis TaxID=1034304 RepID=A0A5N6VUA1_9EURO|nr:hypothetical protein BDV41DRAFT_540439 [Aspergillus transmontanensis]
MLVAITLNLLSTLCQKTIGRLIPINMDRFPIFHQRRVMDDPQDREDLQDLVDALDWDDTPDWDIPYITDPSLSATDRTVFHTLGCTVFGYPSTGGVLIKEADLVDMLFLSLPRSHASQCSPSTEEEDKFCNLMRRTGATLWPHKQDWLQVEAGLRKRTKEQAKVMVYGWPTDGGVWVLRFESPKELPHDFGRIGFAMNMGEKIQIMREYGATFVEDVTQVEELNTN